MADNDRPGNYPEITVGHWWARIHDIIAYLARSEAREVRRNDPHLLIDEHAAVTNGTQVVTYSPTIDHALITSIICYSQNSGAVLQIGLRQIPVVQGLTVISGIDMLVRGQAAFWLTPSVAGNLYVEIMGTQVQEVK